MADWAQPSINDTHVNWELYLKARADSQAKMFDDGVTWTNLPTGTIRWGSSNSRWEEWNGSSWVNLSTALTDVCKTANNLSDLASASTARTNLGLGTMAVVNSPVPVANGGTASTTASDARTALGLGTMATQAASAVAITGGTLSGITALTMTSSSTLSMTSAGTISGASTITNAAALTIRTTGSDHAITIATNTVNRLAINASGIIPSANNTYDIGSGSFTIKDIYTARIIVPTINYAGDIVVQSSGTTKWVFGSGAAFELRPNTNGSQDLGATSYLWNNVYCNRTLAAAGNGVQFVSGGIEYLATSANSHRWFNSGGGVELWKIDGSTGKLLPVYIARGTYTVSGTGIGTGRVIDHAEANAISDANTKLAVRKIYEYVGWMTGDLRALGFLI